MNQRGQITLPLAAALTGATMIISVTAAYFTSQISVNKDIADVGKELQMDVSEVEVKTQANTTNIENIEKRLDRFEDKLDALLVNQGINPTTIK